MGHSTPIAKTVPNHEDGFSLHSHVRMKAGWVHASVLAEWRAIGGEESYARQNGSLERANRLLVLQRKIVRSIPY
jgi:hypothetical protein